MTPTDGTYVIVSVKDVSKALSVEGASDASGANVSLAARDGGDGQIAEVRSQGDGCCTITFPLTGRALDLYDGQAVSGGNVWQYNANGSDAQRWRIVEDSVTTTVAVDGRQCPVVKIAAKKDSRLVIDCEGGGSSSGTNLWVYTDWGDSNTANARAQRWALLPVESVHEGRYMLVTAMDDSVCVGVANHSNANGAKLQLEAVGESDYQLWDVRKAPGGACTFRNAGSGKYVDVPGDGSADYIRNGAELQQYDMDAGDDRHFLAVPRSQARRPWGVVPTSYVACKAGAGYVWDCCAGSTKVGTRLQLFRYWGDADTKNNKAQLFELRRHPTTTAALDVPAGLRLAYGVGGPPYGELWYKGDCEARFTFTSSSRDFQLRYRVRSRRAGQPYRGWSPWRSIADGSESCDGWGSRTTANLHAERERNGRCYAGPVPLSLSPDGYVAHEVQWQLRSFSADVTGTGIEGVSASASRTSRVLFAPTWTLGHMTWTPEGLCIVGASNQRDDGNSLTVYSVAGSKSGTLLDRPEGERVSGVDWDGTAVVTGLERVPEEGEELTAVVRFANRDGAYAEARQAVVGNVSYDEGRSLAISPVAKVDGRAMLSVDARCPGADSYAMWVDDGGAPLKRVSPDGKWDLPAPVNAYFRVWVVVKKGAAWDVWSKRFDAIPLRGILFTWGDDGVLSLSARRPDDPDMRYTVTSDATVTPTNGLDHPVVTFGRSNRCEIPITGLIIPGLDPQSTLGNLDALARAHYAWMRNGSGLVWRVAIMEYEVAEHAKYAEVDVRVARVDA